MRRARRESSCRTSRSCRANRRTPKAHHRTGERSVDAAPSRVTERRWEWRLLTPSHATASERGALGTVHTLSSRKYRGRFGAPKARPVAGADDAAQHGGGKSLFDLGTVTSSTRRITRCFVRRRWRSPNSARCARASREVRMMSFYRRRSVHRERGAQSASVSEPVWTRSAELAPVSEVLRTYRERLTAVYWLDGQDLTLRSDRMAGRPRGYGETTRRYACGVLRGSAQRRAAIAEPPSADGGGGLTARVCSAAEWRRCIL